MRVLASAANDLAVIYDATRLRALPIVFTGTDHPCWDAEREADEFLSFLGRLGQDPRDLCDRTLNNAYARWRMRYPSRERAA